MKLIQCMWLFKTKTKPKGILDKFKAQFVAKVYDQVNGVDYFKTFSPVVKHAIIKIVLALAISKDRCVKQLHIYNVFLIGESHKDVYMR